MNELVSYKSNLRNLKSLLGLGCIHLIEKEELLPYVSRVVEILNTWLTLEDKQTQMENVKLFVEYYEDGLNKLVYKIDKLNADYNYPGDGDFIQRYFIAAWTNVYTTIYMELLYNYPALFTTPSIDCHDCCGSVVDDGNGGLIYAPGPGNFSASFIGCGCGATGGGGGPVDEPDYSDRIEESEIDDLIGL